MQLNDEPGWGPACWEKVTGLPASKTFKTVAEERHEQRRIRVTASNVGKIAKRRPTTQVKSLVQQLIAP